MLEQGEIERSMASLELNGFYGVEIGQTRSKGKEARATYDQVLDPRTFRMLHKLRTNGHINDLSGCISTGKEANVYHSIDSCGNEVAIKIYKTSILVFKDRQKYVQGEFRFKSGSLQHNPRKMVKVWAEKEMRNLKRLRAADISCPKVYAFKSHILVMQFLDNKLGAAAPKLKDINVDLQTFTRLYKELICICKKMYNKCNLVHADLSEYNILYYMQKIAIIDVSQSVEKNHPLSLEFLRKDIYNINSFFRKRRVSTFSLLDIYNFVTENRDQSEQEMLSTLASMNVGNGSTQEERVFLNSFIPQNLNQVYDVERDTLQLIQQGKQDLIYKNLIPDDLFNPQESLYEDFVKDLTQASEAIQDSDESDCQMIESNQKFCKLKRNEDKNEKRARKEAVKDLKRKKRMIKIPKHIKKAYKHNHHK